ncbi:tetratricopeptide repeat protein [Paenalcaligenes sp. Me131]|uniref:tetratricopeptide repeat protein n=1 Tax=Paenalcaligenes sp. Me131 TaxID=3392636 RepID=UPI003D290D85
MRKTLAQLGLLLALFIGGFATSHAQTHRYSPEQLEEMKQLAKDGVAVAQASLGMVYSDGKDLPQNYEQARYWLTLASDQDYALAHVQLGFIYLQGLGVDADQAKALEWFNKACTAGLDGGCKLYERYSN